ncbi:hypothetical protein REPUB_Repub13aG0049200 [Reevesia pubescens]
MSPRKALRAAMLKTRFADTILKAQQILVHGDKAEPMKMQQEKEKLERRLREEKTMVEAHIRAAEAAEVELKKQREKEREAARIAFQKMENTAGIELNLEIVKELDILSGYSLSRGNPLHQLGLFLKDEADPMKMQREKEKLERRLREEKAMVEAHIRVAEAAAKPKADVEVKAQLEKEREAARIALQKMENTAGIELNLEIVKELDILSGYSLSRGNPLHQLGLFLKDEHLEDDANEAFLYEEVEEGEIVS